MRARTIEGIERIRIKGRIPIYEKGKWGEAVLLGEPHLRSAVEINADNARSQNIPKTIKLCGGVGIF